MRIEKEQGAALFLCFLGDLFAWERAVERLWRHEGGLCVGGWSEREADSVFLCGFAWRMGCGETVVVEEREK